MMVLKIRIYLEKRYVSVGEGSGENVQCDANEKMTSTAIVGHALEPQLPICREAPKFLLRFDLLLNITDTCTYDEPQSVLYTIHTVFVSSPWRVLSARTIPSAVSQGGEQLA